MPSFPLIHRVDVWGISYIAMVFFLGKTGDWPVSGP